MSPSFLSYFACIFAAGEINQWGGGEVLQILRTYKGTETVLLRKGNKTHTQNSRTLIYMWEIQGLGKNVLLPLSTSANTEPQKAACSNLGCWVLLFVCLCAHRGESVRNKGDNQWFSLATFPAVRWLWIPAAEMNLPSFPRLPENYRGINSLSYKTYTLTHLARIFHSRF